MFELKRVIYYLVFALFFCFYFLSMPIVVELEQDTCLELRVETKCFFFLTVQALRRSIPAPPANFKLREDHLSGSSLKGECLSTLVQHFVLALLIVAL